MAHRESGEIHHMIFEVSDLDRSKEFYTGVMQLDYVGPAPWHEEGATAAFRTDLGDYVVLVQVPEVVPDAPKVHTGFTVTPEGFRTILARFREVFGDKALKDDFLGERAAGEVATYVNDPDGHRLQVTVWAERSGGEGTYEVPASRKGRVTAGRVGDFPVGSVTYVREGRFFLVRQAEGVLAVNEVCTHQRCRVAYEATNHRYHCPCHQRNFAPSGAVINQNLGVNADTPPLHVYPIEFVDDQIIVDTDHSLPRTEEEAERLVPLPAALSASR